jgi:hypothetical protein
MKSTEIGLRPNPKRSIGTLKGYIFSWKSRLFSFSAFLSYYNSAPAGEKARLLRAHWRFWFGKYFGKIAQLNKLIFHIRSEYLHLKVTINCHTVTRFSGNWAQKNSKMFPFFTFPCEQGEILQLISPVQRTHLTLKQAQQHYNETSSTTLHWNKLNNITMKQAQQHYIETSSTTLHWKKLNNILPLTNRGTAIPLYRQYIFLKYKAQPWLSL